MKNILLKIIILLLILATLNCTSEPKTSIKPDINPEKNNINFGDVKTNEIKIENITLEAESNEKFTGEVSQNYNFISTEIKEIVISDNINYSLDTTDTKMNLDWDETTNFKIIFSPKITGEIDAKITILTTKCDIYINISGTGVN